MRGNMLTFHTSQSVWGNEAAMVWKTPPCTHTSVHTCPGATRHLGQVSPGADANSRGRVRRLWAMQIEITYWVSCSHHQTNPNSSFVYCTSSTTFPRQGWNDSSSPMFPGGAILRPNRTSSPFGFFFPFIESDFSFPSFPTVMFLLDPFGPPTAPALQRCRLEFPSIIWSMTHFWIVGSHGSGTGVPSLGFRPSCLSDHTVDSLTHTCTNITSVCRGSHHLSSQPHWSKKIQNVAKQKECHGNPEKG